jgi:predicted metal-dependent enzyme (double-stranded beta helix superfamily)
MAPTLENTIAACQQQQQQQQQPNAKQKLTTDIMGNAVVHTIESKSAVDSLDHFELLLRKLERAFGRSKSSVDVDEIWRILEDYSSKPNEWAKYAYYDMGKYKRNLVAEYDKYNVMIICWGPGSKSCIHDHAGSHCFMKVLDGELIEGRFAWPDEKTLAGAKSQEMIRIMDTRMRVNDVVYIHGKSHASPIWLAPPRRVHCDSR